RLAQMEAAAAPGQDRRALPRADPFEPGGARGEPRQPRIPAAGDRARHYQRQLLAPAVHSRSRIARTLVSAAAVARPHLRMGACDRYDDRDHCGDPPRNVIRALAEHHSAARDLLRLPDGRPGADQTEPAGEMAAQFNADLVDPRLALSADARVG